MKNLALIITLIFFTACSQKTSADQIARDTFPTPSLTVSNINSNSANSHPQIIEAAELVDKQKLAELEKQNSRFQEVPEEFKNVGWDNFKFPKFRLKDGEYEEIYKKHPGGTSYILGEVFYLDLIGDAKKEAVVFVWKVSCGVSCDGGSKTIYFYFLRTGKPALLDSLETGCRSCGCFIKSFKIENKKIHLEQFGNCRKDSLRDDSSGYVCKFCAKNITKSVYSFNQKATLVRNSVEIVETPVHNVINYETEMIINE